jgi:hypothetical protein
VKDELVIVTYGEVASTTRSNSPMLLTTSGSNPVLASIAATTPPPSTLSNTQQMNPPAKVENSATSHRQRDEDQARSAVKTNASVAAAATQAQTSV